MKPQDLRQLLQKKKEKQLLIDLIFIEHLKLRGELKEEHFDRIAMGIKKVFTNQKNRVEFNDIQVLSKLDLIKQGKIPNNDNLIRGTIQEVKKDE